jgi:hypothetical protein
VPSTSIEWALTAPGYSGDGAVVPDALRPVFAALREALPHENIPPAHYRTGWFERGARAWKVACANRLGPFVARPAPFALLDEILRAGYPTSSAARRDARPGSD